MSLRSKSFFVAKGDPLDQITAFIERELGLDAFLIKELQASSPNKLTTELTLLYQKYDEEILTSLAPREGGIFTTGVTPNNNFDVRVLFSHPIDPNSLLSGAIIADGNELSSSEYYLDPSCNNYFLKVNLSGYVSEQFHDYRLNSSKIRRYDGSLFPYSFVAGYTIHEQSSAHLGDRSSKFKPRGKVKADVIRIQKSTTPQQAISEYLSNKNLDVNSLISYTTLAKDVNIIEIYLLYISAPEPQIVQGFPLTHSLFPDVSAPGYVNLVFSTKLDSAQFKLVPNLFSIESSFSSSVPIDQSDITLLSDGKTIRINTSNYFTDQKIYSILARPGIKSDIGTIKIKPDQWVIHVNKYVLSSSTFSGSLSGAPTDAQYIVASANSSLTNEKVISIVYGLTGSSVGSTYIISGVPATTGSPGVASFNSQYFSGDSFGRFSVVESGISHNNLLNVGSNTHSQIDTAISTANTHYSNTNNPHSTTAAQVGAPSTTNYDYLSGITNSHTTNTSNPHSTTAAQVGAPTTSNYSYLSGIANSHIVNVSNPHSTTASQVGAPTIGDYSYLSGIANSHFTNTSNPHSTTAAQLSDFTEATQDVIGSLLSPGSGVGITYNDGSNTLSISGLYATTARHGIAQFSTQFSISDGVVTFTGAVSSTSGQPSNGHLSGLATVAPTGTSTVHNYVYYTGLNLPTTGNMTSYIRTLLDDANASTARTTLGVVIGTNVQGWSSDLDQLIAVSPNAGRIIIGDLSNQWSRLDAGSPGALLMIDSDGIPSWLEPGAENQTLRINGGFPTWMGP